MNALRRVTAELAALCVATLGGSGWAASGASVQWHYIGYNGVPPPPFTLDPPYPTTTNTVSFIAVTDGQVYVNWCFASVVNGDPSIMVDSTNHIITVSFSPPVTNIACPMVVFPVSGVDGQFGPLQPGVWSFNLLQYSYRFKVAEASLALSIQAVANSSALQLDWPLAGENFVLECKEGLSAANWQLVTNPPSTISNRNTVQLPNDSDGRFFRLRQVSP